MEDKEIEATIIQVCLRIAKRGEGSLIVVGECDYQTLVEQTVPSFNIIENPKLLESLALMDGAVVIDRNGFLKAYGTKIKSPFIWKNFGTRTSAGYSASMKDGTTVYVTSQEDTKIKIFKHGKLIMEIDGKQKGIENKIPEISKLVESVGWGTLGATLVAPFLGIVAIPGITIFFATTGIVYAIKKMKEEGIIK
jgi:hypothetical protein